MGVRHFPDGIGDRSRIPNLIFGISPAIPILRIGRARGRPLDPAGALPLRPHSAGGRRSPKRLTSLPVCSALPSVGGLATFAEDDSANVKRPGGVAGPFPNLAMSFYKCRKPDFSRNKSGDLHRSPLCIARRYYSHSLASAPSAEWRGLRPLQTAPNLSSTEHGTRNTGGCVVVHPLCSSPLVQLLRDTKKQGGR